MPEQAEKTETEVKEVHRLDLINGRMPLPLVYLIRFEEGDLKNSEVAAKYFTSTGKVDDIRKNRNFAYIGESTVFAPADVEAAKAHIQKPSLQGHNISDENQASINKMLDTLPTDEAAAAAITEARKSVRKTKSVTTEEEDEEDLSSRV